MSKVRFGDILYIKGRIGWQALSKDEYLKTGDYYLITGVDITDTHRINFSNCYYVSKERYDMDEKIQLKVGDIIVTKDGTIGKIGIIDKLDKPATLNSHLFLIRNEAPEILDTNFLFQILRSNQFQKFAQNNTHGSNIPAFTQSNISEFEIDLPTLGVQRKIANVLKNIDDKIINNIDTNSEFESMAKTIYDYWFLQFEFPNAEGKPYKSSGGKMVYNEQLKKEIPEGWEVKSIGSNANLYQPQTISGDALIENAPYNVYGANGIIGKYDKYNHEENEIAICCRGAGCGEFLMTTPKSWITGNAMVVSPNDATFKEYLYYSLYVLGIKSFITGSAQPQITRANLEKMTMIVPKKSVVLKFNDLIIPTRKKLIEIFNENQELISLRDFLLPLLMNGQVTFKDEKEELENQVQQAVVLTYVERFTKWKQVQGYAARGDVDDEILKKIFDAMEEDDKK